MKTVEETATGCDNANSYREFAYDHGYFMIVDLDNHSSAGDWTFLISKDGYEWQLLFQENNYPQIGFTHTIGDCLYFGEINDVLRQLLEEIK